MCPIKCILYNTKTTLGTDIIETSRYICRTGTVSYKTGVPVLLYRYLPINKQMEYRYCICTVTVVTSVVDPNKLNLNPDQGSWPNLDPGLYRYHPF